MSLRISEQEYTRLASKAKGGKQKPPRYQASEDAEQVALFAWVDIVTPRAPQLEYLFHPPMGGLRDPQVGAQLKAMGARAGVNDLILIWPSRGFGGLMAELKVAGNDLEPEQVIWQARAEAVGWHVATYYGWVAAALGLCWYLDLNPNLMGLDSVSLGVAHYGKR